MINGLVLFAKTGGSTLALEGVVRPVAYHEPRERFRSIMFSRQSEGLLDVSPITDELCYLGDALWDRGLVGDRNHRSYMDCVDLVHGSLPTEAEYARIVRRELGEESRKTTGDKNGEVRTREVPQRNLYEQIYELAKEIKPKFLFFEIRNVSFRHLEQNNARFSEEISNLGYDCRWDTLSAHDVGSPQKRERVYLLARKREGVDVREKAVRIEPHLDRGYAALSEDNPFPDGRILWDDGVVERTPERVAEVKAGIDEVCVPQYREAFLRLTGLKEIV
jgi:site-specific DNA-cytosine methylase